MVRCLVIRRFIAEVRCLLRAGGTGSPWGTGPGTRYLPLSRGRVSVFWAALSWLTISAENFSTLSDTADQFIKQFIQLFI